MTKERIKEVFGKAVDESFKIVRERGDKLLESRDWHRDFPDIHGMDIVRLAMITCLEEEVRQYQPLGILKRLKDSMAYEYVGCK